MKGKRFVAFDLGAESGRAIAGTIAGGKLELDILHRFPNGAVKVADHMFWDVLGIFRELQNGLRAYSAKYGKDLAGVGIDTWGVDFGLLDENGLLLGNPYHYRDSRTDGIPAKVFKVVPQQKIYSSVGIQSMFFNTLYQFYSMKAEKHPLLDKAKTLLFMPDLLNYFFTGKKVCEFSIASTSQMFSCATGKWDTGLLKKLGLPANILPKVSKTGTVVGKLLEHICAETGVNAAPVIAPAEHDTASAVAAVPAQGDDWCFLSSGTWSLLGVELPKPILTKEACAFNYTNEGGVNNTTRFLKNIMGLWLVQECRRSWLRQGEKLEYGQMVDLAKKEKAFRSLIYPDNNAFAAPADMPRAFADFCKRSGQPVPSSKGQIVRCAFESLALMYRVALADLEKLTGRKIKTIHIVGGGSQNKLLNQFTADATGRTVVAGPVEATAAGNIMMQAIAMKQIKSLAEGRSMIRRSFPLETFKPRDTAAWDAQAERFAKLAKVK